MKFCRSCGTQLEDSAAFCHQCGEACEQPRQESRQEIAPTQQQQTYQQNTAPRESGMTTVIKVMMILGTVSSAAWILPLAWCIPMYISYENKLKNHEPISDGFKVCVLLFVNTIAGILMFCDKDN